jgi:hypothetical protein
MKILYFGDIVGKLGRAGIVRQLPLWQSEHKPDIVVANGENLAHGNGIGRTQAAEMFATGIDVLTGGNHSFEGQGSLEILADPEVPIIRPANASAKLPGRGFLSVTAKNSEKLLVINLISQEAGRYHYDSPFDALDIILAETTGEAKHILLDWHAETTSEKAVMGWYADGKVSAVVGSHTHIPTADAKILPQGTGYISDVGMTGPYNSVIGVDPSDSIERFTKQLPIKPKIIEQGPIEINAVFIETEPNTGKTVHIEHLRKVVEK